MSGAVRALDPARDLAAALSLWERALGDRWPVHWWFLGASMPSGYVVDGDDGLAGMIGVDLAGAITLLVVDPRRQRRGIGTALHRAAIDALRGAGRDRVQLGSGGAHYVWPGIPRDLPGARRFFARLGWRDEHVTWDLVSDLGDRTLPEGFARRTEEAGVSFALCDAGSAASVIAYEEREHPTWVGIFRERLAGDPSSVVLARGTGGEVVGALEMDIPPDHPCRWWRLLGDDSASIGCVGVAASRNGEGIGTAMMAFAADHLRARGIATAYVGWCVRLGFYGRLGYRTWREYQMASRLI